MLQPEDLAALACQEGVEARLVIEGGDGAAWQVRHGPFGEDDFSALGTGGWSLLVQEVNRWVDPVADLLERFRFVPHWRIEDVMVSYAPSGGSVGAHVDAYDVFLLQGAGRRRWSIESESRENPEYRPGLDLKIFESFQPDTHWDLGPGDLLYLPPGIPHHGVNLEPGLTYSIGFRAPAPHEWLAAWARESLPAAIAAAENKAPFSDPDRGPSARPGRIPEQDLSRLREWIQSALDDRIGLHRWIGGYLTRPRGLDPAEIEPEVLFPDTDIPEHPNATEIPPTLRRSAPADFSWIPLDDGAPDGAIDLFVGGRRYFLPQDLRPVGEWLCDSERLVTESLSTARNDSRIRWLLCDLLDRGFLLTDDSAP